MPTVSLQEILHRPGETQGVEFKRGEAWNTLKDKIIKACLAMANTLGGGVIVIGVTDSDGRHQVEGVEEAHLSGYSIDHIAPAVNKHADPPIRIHVIKEEYEGKHFVLIQVDEFEYMPVICKKPLGDSLKRGKLYSRPTGRVESSEVQDHYELRQILNRAIDKGVGRFSRRAAAAGLSLASAASPDGFTKRSKTFCDELLTQASGSPPILVTDIRPGEHDQVHLEVGQLEPMIKRCHFHNYGWFFPLIDRNGVASVSDHLASSLDNSRSIDEKWRFFQDGQFIHCRSIQSREFDPKQPWRNTPDLAQQSAPSDFTPSGHIYFTGLIIRVTLATQFASNLAVALDQSSRLILRFSFLNVRNAVLTPESPRRIMHGLLAAGEDFTVEIAAGIEEVAAVPFEIASGLLTDKILPRFQMNNVPREVIDQIQRQSLGHEVA